MWEPADRLLVSLAPVLREPAAAVVTRQRPQRAQVSSPVALVPSWDGTEMRCRAFTLRCRKNALSTDPLDLHTTVESLSDSPGKALPSGVTGRAPYLRRSAIGTRPADHCGEPRAGASEKVPG